MQDEFSKAFNGEEMAQGEDDSTPVAMTIDPEAAVADAAEEAGIEPAPEQEEAPAEPAAEAPMEEPVEPAAEPDGDEAMSPEDIQRQKSWEGRLKKREEELAARESAVPSVTIDDSEIAGIRQQLTDDFGEEFVTMISKLAAHEAQKLAASGMDERLSPMQETIAQAINDVQQAFASMHFSAIADAHADFQEIVNSPEFSAFVQGLSGEEQEVAAQVLQSGTPKQVISLLNDYKNAMTSKQMPEEGEDPALEAAEGVRGSAPVTLPGRVPVNADDEYRAAWNAM